MENVIVTYLLILVSYFGFYKLITNVKSTKTCLIKIAYYSLFIIQICDCNPKFCHCEFANVNYLVDEAHLTQRLSASTRVQIIKVLFRSSLHTSSHRKGTNSYFSFTSQVWENNRAELGYLAKVLIYVTSDVKTWFGLVWFVWFYGISTFVGYLTPNPFLCE